MTNTATAAERWVAEIEKRQDECQRIMMDAAAKCAPIKAEISEAKAAAKNEGISIKALSALILERKHLRNAAKVREKLEDDDLVAELEMLRDQVSAVAGTEDLFSFAVEQIDGEIRSRKGGRAAEAAQARSDALDDLTSGNDAFDGPDPRPSHLRDAHAQAEEEAAERNIAALLEGVRPLN